MERTAFNLPEEKSHNRLIKQRGVTLLEIIIVLGIIGVIAAGVVVLAQRAFTAQDISDIQNNTNSIRTSMTEAFKDEGEYPPATTEAVTLTKSEIATSDDLAPIVTLNKLGKISPSESFNGISGDAFQIGQALVDSESTVHKGFVVLVSGLDQQTCRNLLSQMGNQWDYVGIISAPAGEDESTELNGTELDADKKAGTVLKSLSVAEDITSTDIVDEATCNIGGANNGIVFGSK
ncbi:type IV pilus major pilin [Pseudescherichia sp.]|uniref:type IV pilus major pilin n=1 Tax=Pseudescherichia sp. TaxID=2055881 RepID=UPI0028A187CF|nr:type IV pilus major pilin [Pseudescherichia sp.]